MNGYISHGLPPLCTSGNRIVDTQTGESVILRGVNRSGLEYSEPADGGFLSSAGLSWCEVREIVQGWGANVIRLPINQDWVLHGRGGCSAESYRQSLDSVIGWAASAGAYTLLDLQWLDADTSFGHLSDGSVNHVPPLPNIASIELWTVLAERYRDEPAVLYDLFNEPHTPLKDDLNPIYFVREGGEIEAGDPREFCAKEWNRWAGRLRTAIRQINAGALLWVSGVDWGFDLRGVHIQSPHVVYSVHVYPNRPRRQWGGRFGRMLSGHPLFIGEWGGGDEDLAWGTKLVAYMRKVACGWTAWSWADFPKLVENGPAGDYRPTKFGDLVRSELLCAFDSARERMWIAGGNDR
jgi:endoglucanase